LGAAWGLLGEAIDVDGAAAIRAGADQAKVEVEVLLPNDGRLTVARTVRTRGRSVVEPVLEGKRISEQEMLTTIDNSFGVSSPVLGQLAFMLGGGHLTAKEFELRDHLYRVFDVANLLDSAEKAESHARRATRSREELRRVERSHDASDAALRAQIEDADVRLDELLQRRKELATAEAESHRGLREAEKWVEYRNLFADRDFQIEEAGAAARQLLPQLDVSDPRTALETAEARVQQDIDDSTAAVIKTQVDLRGAREASERLGEVGSLCPTCLQPISREQARAALGRHRQVITESQVALERLNQQVEKLKSSRAEIRALLRRLTSIPGPPRQPGTQEVELEDALRDHGRAAEALQKHDELIGTLRGGRTRLEAEFRQLEEMRAAEAGLRTAYRREALSKAAAEVLHRTAQAAIAQKIDPLTNEVAWRWKKLFGTDDLVMEPSGRIYRKVGGREIDLANLSGGEKIWALLVARLLVLSSSTRVPFVWLDEPLEHLDP